MTGTNGELEFIEDTHQYFIDDVELKPVTSFIKQFFNEFNVEEQATKYANKKGLNKEAVIKEWEQKRDIACAHGTLVHTEIETLIRNNKHDKLLLPIMNPKAVLAFEWLTTNKLYTEAVSVRPEEKIYSTKYRVAGTIDLFLQHKDRKVILVDWKTNEKPELATYSFGHNGKGACKNVPDAKYYHYELQLSTYAFLLEEEYGFKIKELILVHLNSKGEVVEHRVKYRKRIVKNMFKEYLNENK